MRNNDLTEKINHPHHYNYNGMECADAIKAMTAGIDGYLGFCLGNVLKYLWRWPFKGEPLEDLKKAEWYLMEAINQLEAANGQ